MVAAAVIKIGRILERLSFSTASFTGIPFFRFRFNLFTTPKVLKPKKLGNFIGYCYDFKKRYCIPKSGILSL